MKHECPAHGPYECLNPPKWCTQVYETAEECNACEEETGCVWVSQCCAVDMDNMDTICQGCGEFTGFECARHGEEYRG